jgi:hypothetical protein
MPGIRTPFHPRLLGQTARQFFPEVVRLESPTVTDAPSGSGARKVAWNLEMEVRATVTPVVRLGEEWRNFRLPFVFLQITHMIELDGYYPEITNNWRVVEPSGQVHNIQSSMLDSHSKLTRLHTRIMSPTAVEGL